MPTTIYGFRTLSSRRTMRIRFRTTSSRNIVEEAKGHPSGSPPTTGSTASTWKTTASNASTRLRGQRPHGRAGVLGRGRGRRHHLLCRHGVGHRLPRQGAGPAFGTQCPAVQLFGDTCRLLRRTEYPAAACRAGGAGSDPLRAVRDGKHGGAEKGRALPRRRGQVGVRQRTALYLVTADAEIYRYERRDGELAAVGKFPGS